MDNVDEASSSTPAQPPALTHLQLLKEAVLACDSKRTAEAVKALLEEKEPWSQSDITECIEKFVGAFDTAKHANSNEAVKERAETLIALLEANVRTLDSNINKAVANGDVNTASIMALVGPVDSQVNVASAVLSLKEMTIDKYVDKRIFQNKRKLALMRVAIIGDVDMLRSFIEDLQDIPDLLAYIAISNGDLELFKLVFGNCNLVNADMCVLLTKYAVAKNCLHFIPHILDRYSTKDPYIKKSIEELIYNALSASIKKRELSVYSDLKRFADKYCPDILKAGTDLPVDDLVLTAVKHNFMPALVDMREAITSEDFTYSLADLADIAKGGNYRRVEMFLRELE